MKIFIVAVSVGFVSAIFNAITASDTHGTLGWATAAILFVAILVYRLRTE